MGRMRQAVLSGDPCPNQVLRGQRTAGPLPQRGGCQAVKPHTASSVKPRGRQTLMGRGLSQPGSLSPGLGLGSDSASGREIAAAGRPEQVGWDRVVMGTQLQRAGQ